MRLVYKHSPRLAHLTHYVGDVRTTNLGLLDRYLLKARVQPPHEDPLPIALARGEPICAY